MRKRFRQFGSIHRIRHPKRRNGCLAPSPYPPPPRELAGKWIAWSRDGQILFSGDALGPLMDRVEQEGIRGVSYEVLPKIGSIQVPAS